jgi:cytochrome c oxidase subunit III
MAGNSKTEHHYAHHFDSAEHEYLTAKQGTWVFLCTEILMFGGLFVAYAIFHSLYPDLFKEGASNLNWKLGAANTVVLLVSSLTMALGIHYIQVKKQATASWMLILTLICGCIFMAIKGFEYSGKIHHGLLPGYWYHGEIGAIKNIALYFSFYFMMTGLHAIHVLIGMGLITWVLIRNLRGEFSEHYYLPVEMVGLFWHLVDLVWIYLFPLLYLVG